ncbi:extracellular solute-binding protein [Streptomyces sp. NPDC051018]|uniref:ABC transporter substrate-binding protein n=1 Tax=Streptomyces sp. NPDC051018 TaxID=3365639 RepID=UPI00379F1D7E
MEGSRRTGGRRRVPVVLVAVGTLVAALTAGCGSGDSGGGKVRLTIGTFNDFGFKDLYKEYMEKNPDVTIVERVSDYQTHHKQLATQLAAGRGAPDVVAVEGDFLAQFTAQPQKFRNLYDFGAGELESQWLPWKWAQSKADAKTQIGLGTDVGGLAICYRKDLFEKAGLPSDRKSVSGLWPDWESYIRTGERFMEAKTGAKFFDSGALMFNAVLGQAPKAFYDEDDSLIVETNPAVKESFDLVTKATEAGLSANIAAFSPAWGTAFQQGKFATVTCPAWVTAFIQSQAPKTSGQWDIASVPGGGGGNWGGSWLTVPKQSKNADEAYKLAQWLTAPEQAMKVFKKIGNLPSTPSLYEDPAMTGFRKPFFGDAPIGQIFTDSAKALKPQYQGPASAAVRLAVQNGIRRVEQGSESPAEAWKKAVSDAKKAAD